MLDRQRQFRDVQRESGRQAWKTSLDDGPGLLGWPAHEIDLRRVSRQCETRRPELKPRACPQAARQHPVETLDSHASEPCTETFAFMARAHEPDRRTAVPAIFDDDAAVIAHDLHGPIPGCGKPAGQPRHHAVREHDVGDRIVRRQCRGLLPRALVVEQARGKSLHLARRAEERAQPGQVIAGMFQRAANLEFVPARPWRAGSARPALPAVAEHHAILHLGIHQPDLPDPSCGNGGPGRFRRFAQNSCRGG